MQNSSERFVNRALIAAALLCSAAPAGADIYHYNNILIGDRAAGLGGAYTAVSDDPSGLYYNPAGVAHADGASINGSVNAFHYTYSEYKNVLGNKTWARESMGLVPNFFGIIQPFAGGMVGLSVVVTDAVNEDQDQHFTNFTPPGSLEVRDFYINFNNQDTTYNIGPSFALKLRENLTIGLTLYGHYRQQQYILNQQIYYIVDPLDPTKDKQKWTNDYWQVTEYGVNPVIGIMWSPLERLSLGLGVRKTFVLQSDTRLQSSAAETASGSTPAPPFDIPAPNIGESTARRVLPLQINGGAAFFASDRLLFCSDFTWSQSVNASQSILNIAVGTEYYLHAQWALRAGVFSNLSNTSELSSTKKNQNEHVDLYGGSISISRFTRNSSLTLGFSGSVGSGKAQMLRNDYAQQDMEMRTITTFLAAGNSF